MTSTWKEWNEDNVTEYYCDNCKEEALTKQKKQGGFEYVLSRFCPYCGAKMSNTKQ